MAHTTSCRRLTQFVTRYSIATSNTPPRKNAGTNRAIECSTPATSATFAAGGAASAALRAATAASETADGTSAEDCKTAGTREMAEVATFSALETACWAR